MSAVGELGRGSARGASMKIPGVPRWLSSAAIGQTFIPVPGLGALLGAPLVNQLTSSPSHISPRAIGRAAVQGLQLKRGDTPASVVADMAKIDAKQGENDTTAVAWNAINRKVPGARLATNLVGSIVTDPLTYVTLGTESLTKSGFQMMEDLGMSDDVIRNLRLSGWENGLSDADKARIIAKAGGEDTHIVQALKANARGGLGLRFPFASPTGRTVPGTGYRTGQAVRGLIEDTVGQTWLGGKIGEASGAIKQAGRHLFYPDAELYKNPDLGGRVRRQIYESANEATSKSTAATEAAGLRMLQPSRGLGATTDELQGVVGDALDLHGFRDNLDDRMQAVYDGVDQVRRTVDQELKARGKVPDPAAVNDAIGKEILRRTKRGQDLADQVELWRTRANEAAYRSPPGKPGPGAQAPPTIIPPQPVPGAAPAAAEVLTPTVAPTPAVLPQPPAPPPPPAAVLGEPPPNVPPTAPYGVIPQTPAPVVTVKSVPNDVIDRYTQANPGHGVVEKGKFKAHTNIQIKTDELDALKAEAQKMADSGHAGARDWLASMAPAEAPASLLPPSLSQARANAQRVMKNIAGKIPPQEEAAYAARLASIKDDPEALTNLFDEIKARYPEHTSGPGAKAAGSRPPREPHRLGVDTADTGTDAAGTPRTDVYGPKGPKNGSVRIGEVRGEGDRWHYEGDLGKVGGAGMFDSKDEAISALMTAYRRTLPSDEAAIWDSRIAAKANARHVSMLQEQGLLPKKAEPGPTPVPKAEPGEPAGTKLPSKPKNIDEAIATGNFGEPTPGENPMYTILRENQRKLNELGPAPEPPKGEDWGNLRSHAAQIVKNDATRAAGETPSSYAAQSDPYWRKFYGKANAEQKAFMDKMLEAERSASGVSLPPKTVLPVADELAAARTDAKRLVELQNIDKPTAAHADEMNGLIADWRNRIKAASPADRLTMNKYLTDEQTAARRAAEEAAGTAMPPVEEIAKPTKKPAPTSAKQVRQPDGAVQPADRSVGPIEPEHAQPLPPAETVADAEKATVETQLPTPPKAPPPRALRWSDQHDAFLVTGDDGKTVGMVKPTSDGERFVARTKGQELPTRYTSPEDAAAAIHEAQKPTTVLAPEPSGQGTLPTAPSGPGGAEQAPGAPAPTPKAGGGAPPAPPSGGGGAGGGGPTNPSGWQGPGKGPWDRGARAAQTRIWATLHMQNAQRSLETNARLLDELLAKQSRGVLEIEDYRPRVLTKWGKDFARKYPTMAEKYGITPDAMDRFLAPRHVKPESTLRQINDEIRQFATDNGMKPGHFFEPNPVVGQLVRTQSAYTSMFSQDMVQKWAQIKDAKGEPIFRVLKELPQVPEDTPALIKQLRGEYDIPEGWRVDTLPMGENGEHIAVAAPEEVIATIKPLLKISDPNQVLQFYDVGLAYWKAMATVPVIPLPTGVGFHLRNASSNVMLNWLSNVGIRMGDYTAMFKLQWKMWRSHSAFGDLRMLSEPEQALVERMYDEGTFRPAFMGQLEQQGPVSVLGQHVVHPKAMTAAERKTWLRKGLSLTPIRREGGKWIPNVDTWWVKSGGKVGEAVETNARMAHYVAAERAMGDTARAGASMRKWLFDYGDLSPFEKNVMRRTMPFYTYTRKVIPRVAEAVLTNPRKLSQFELVRKALTSELAPDQAQQEATTLKPNYLDQYPGLVPITPHAWPSWAQKATGFLTGNPKLGYLQMDTPFDVPFQQMDAWAGIASDAVEGVPGLRRLPDSKTGWEDFFQTQASMLGGPVAGLAKAGAEVQGGRDFFSGAPIRHEPVPAPFPLNWLGRGGLARHPRSQHPRRGPQGDDQRGRAPVPLRAAPADPEVGRNPPLRPEEQGEGQAAAGERVHRPGRVSDRPADREQRGVLPSEPHRPVLGRLPSSHRPVKAGVRSQDRRVQAAGRCHRRRWLKVALGEVTMRKVIVVVFLVCLSLGLAFWGPVAGANVLSCGGPCPTTTYPTTTMATTNPTTTMSTTTSTSTSSSSTSSSTSTSCPDCGTNPLTVPTTPSTTIATTTTCGVNTTQETAPPTSGRGGGGTTTPTTAASTTATTGPSRAGLPPEATDQFATTVAPSATTSSTTTGLPVTGANDALWWVALGAVIVVAFGLALIAGSRRGVRR